MIEILQHVDVSELRAEMWRALHVADRVFSEYKSNCTVTSACDGAHSSKSFHYLGLAVDCRIHNVAVSERDKFATELQIKLGDSYQVILKSSHLHIEYDPRARIHNQRLIERAA